jgi:hypothetical protein
MSEPRVRSRKAVPRRNGLIQESLLATGPEAAEAAPTSADPPGGAGESYRATLAGWPLRWRERWGRRANALEDLGLGWRSAELRAFREVGEERLKKTESRPSRAMELVGRN